MSQTPTFPEMLRSAIDARLADLHVSMPARVESYDASRLSVDVQPLIRHAYFDESGTRKTEAYPVVPSVPVKFLGSGAYRITFPIAKGDIVLLVFSEASIDKWLQNEGVVDPIDDRRNQMIDAVAIPGLRSFKSPTAASEDALVIDVPTEIRLGSDSASSLVALYNELKTAYDLHVHPDPSSGFTGAPTIALPTNVGATKVKAE